jgi:hypothetical protein
MRRNIDLVKYQQRESWLRLASVVVSYNNLAETYDPEIQQQTEQKVISASQQLFGSIGL